MYDPLEVLLSNRFFQLFHKDPCTDGSDSSCRHAKMNYPYMPETQTEEPTPEQNRIFLRDLRRARRSLWFHVHHWRFARGWLLRKPSPPTLMELRA